MGKMRGKWHRYRGIPTLVTYHPSYLLQNARGQERCLGRLADAHERDGDCSAA